MAEKHLSLKSSARLCAGLPFEDFTKLVTAIRAAVGPAVPLWANECCGTITGGRVGNASSIANPGQWSYIPKELDYISYDCYSVPGDGWMTPNEPPSHWNGTAEPLMARHAYKNWYHMLHEHQRVMQLPGLFGWNETVCPREVQIAALLDKLRGFWKWAKEDPLVVGMSPWHMNDRTANMGANMGPGAINFPPVLAEMRRMLTNLA